jgi:TPP-dependent pyruvate/acetoin dehydrogenase alpha subunit
VARTEQLILENNWADAETLKKWRAEISAEVGKAVETAQREAAPVGSEEDWCALATREIVDQTL